LSSQSDFFLSVFVAEAGHPRSEPPTMREITNHGNFPNWHE